jgi:long-subunit acyl-CoA synthetase (AMP-forming)
LTEARLTVPQVLDRTAEKHGDVPALMHKADGQWLPISWAQYREQIYQVARGFIELGLEPGKGVAILGFNRPEWFLSDMGALVAGGIPAGIYTTSSPEQAVYIAQHCEAQIVVVEHLDYLEQLLAVADQLPELKAIVIMAGISGEQGVYSWQDVLDLGAAAGDEELDARLAAQQPDDCCTLIYTSGTTGPPKAVMLSHHNLVWTAQALIDNFEFTAGERVISYLPLSHIAEQIISIHGALGIGGTTWFAESIEKLGDNLRECRPHIFFAVPRVWEKMQAKVGEALAGATGIKAALLSWARGVALKASYREQRGQSPPLFHGFANKILLKIHQQLGLDQARIRSVGAAPTTRDTHEFFMSLGLPIYEVYGQSEDTGPATFSLPDAYRTGKTGRAIPGTEVRIAEDGEVLLRGPHVFLGYLKNPEATAETLDDEGWLHTGDIGELDEEGYLQITDRKKELIITSGGKNISPANIEALLKSIPAVSQAAVIGDGRKYLAALLTLDPEKLEREAQAAGSDARTVAEAADDDAFQRYIEGQIESINERLSNVEGIKRFRLLDRDFGVATGELTPTMKLKRRVIATNFEAEIDGLYPPAE